MMEVARRSTNTSGESASRLRCAHDGPRAKSRSGERHRIAFLSRRRPRGKRPEWLGQRPKQDASLLVRFNRSTTWRWRRWAKKHEESLVEGPWRFSRFARQFRRDARSRALPCPVALITECKPRALKRFDMEKPRQRPGGSDVFRPRRLNK